MNKKIIAREYAPDVIDFRFYFDNDGMTERGGKNCAVYIPPTRRMNGFNGDEYLDIVQQAENIIDGFNDIDNKWKNGYNSYDTFKECMEFNGITYSSRKCNLLKKWAKNANIDDMDSITEFLTIITGLQWESRYFTGYSQCDYCDVIYCADTYTDDAITEIGKMWLGCGTEFELDGVGGYFVIDNVRWGEGAKLRDTLAALYGCKPDELEVHLYVGEHRVADYKILEVNA